MKYAIVTNGVVANIVAAEADFAAEQGWIEAPSGVSPGWTYDGTFAAPVIPVEVLRAAIKPVTMRQARLALLGAGVLSGVDAAIAAMPSPQKETAQIEWEYATEVRRDNALIAAIGVALGLTATQIDDLFRTAAAL